MRERTRSDGFLRDFIAAVGAWGKQPALPLISVLVWAGPGFIPDETALLVVELLILLFSAGWAGTERIWYLRAFRGVGIRPTEAWNLTWSFVGRFVRLGLLVFLALMPALVIGYWNTSLMLLAIAILGVPIDTALTFVLPALSYSTNSVGAALRIGLRMIRTEWPASAVYVLLPPLAMLAAVRVLPASKVGVAGRIGITVATTLLYIAFKGATAAFYLRRHDIGRNGAAFMEEPQS